MESPFSTPGFNPEQAYTAAAERFFELLKSFSAAPTAAPQQDWSNLAAPLAAQFEQWLRASQSAGPWFSGAQFNPFAARTAGAGFAPQSFGPLPLGAAAVPGVEGERTWELLTRLAQLQGRLATHWGEIARSAAQRFVSRAGTLAGTPTIEQVLKLYELWVQCAEEAYGATARGEDFSSLQSELANVSAGLLVEQRRHAEALVKAFGLPTRTEVDALYAQLKELRRTVGELSGQAPRKRPARASRPARKRSAKRTGGR